MKPRAGDYERDAESGLLLPRHARRGLARVHPQFMCGPGFFGGSDGDPYFSSVVALLHMDTNYADSSSYARTFSGFGNAAISTAQSKFGGASLVLDGTGDYLTTPDAAAMELGSSDFTVEAFIRPSDIPAGGAYRGVFSKRNTSTDLSWNFSLDGDASGKMRFYYSTSGTSITGSADSASALSANTWYHVAAVRNGSSLIVYLDGVGGTSHNIGASTIADKTMALAIGRQSLTASNKGDFNGYIDEVRITVGVARYTANFTPPSAPFPNS